VVFRELEEKKAKKTDWIFTYWSAALSEENCGFKRMVLTGAKNI
jgi:hypothetical protein